jgi:hypothetical protein
MISGLFEAISICSFFCLFVSIVKMFFYLRNIGSDIKWGGAYFGQLFTEYFDHTKKNQGVVGCWFYFAICSFIVIFLSFIGIIFTS